MKRSWLNLLLTVVMVVAMVLTGATPAFAQDPDAVPDALPDGYGELPEGFEVVSQVFLPMTTLDDAAVEIADVEEVDVSAAAATSASQVRLDALKLPAALETTAPTGLSRELRGLTGRTQVVVRLTQPSVAAVVGAAGEDEVVAAEVQDEVSAAALSQQDQIIRWVTQRDPSATMVARLKVVLNALIFDVDASLLPALSTLPGVEAVSPVRNYEKDLPETVPAIGATRVQKAGYTGAGVNVAVLDSGIDYTHVAFGGAGTEEAYIAAYSDPVDPAGFPTAKVTKGYDFVGELWDGDEVLTLSPDADPIDTFDGHGTHVSDIIAGQLGVAPDANIWAVKVCSAVSTACSGIAILQGLEYAVDPNGDGRIHDAADIINMSLGAIYGQIVADDVLAVENATRAGVLVVASAGNSADRPYITGSPSVAPGAISVAQTTVPSDRVDRITAPGLATPALAVHQPWSPDAAGVISAPLDYPATNQDGCGAFPANYFSGKLALVDRGTCNISVKMSNAAAAGAVAVLIANNAAQSPTDLPPIFSFGGGDHFAPTFSVTLADGNRLKAINGAVATIDPANGVNIARTMVASSSRGPSYSLQTIKPDIGAPGASVSAVGATGTETSAFGGTSGAAPMVAGSAALLLQASPNLKPFEVRALLMNNAETQISMNPVTQPGYLAPITRIGGGEVRVDKAVAAKAIAYDKSTKQGSLSFGYHALIHSSLFRKTVEVRNLTNQTQTYQISRSTRYPEDAWGTSWGVNVYAPKEVRVPARGKASFNVTLYVYANGLPSWPWTWLYGSGNGNGSLLQAAEFDGFITLHQGSRADALTIPWQILPRRASHVTALTDDYRLTSKRDVKLVNLGTEEGAVNSFALLGTSPRIPRKYLPTIGDNFAIGDLRAFGARDIMYGPDAVLEVGISTFGMRAHPAYPIEYDVWIDVNGDGRDDFIAYTAEVGGPGASGLVAVYVAPTTTFVGTAWFYLDADLDSGNAILPIPYELMGIAPGTKLTLSVETFDNYFQGVVTDGIYDKVFTGASPKYGPILVDQPVSPYGLYSFKPVGFRGGAVASPSQIGLLLLYRNQKADYEADLIKIK